MTEHEAGIEEAGARARAYEAMRSNPLPDPEAAATRAPGETAVPPPPPRLVEAMLFVGGAPLTAARACEVVHGLTPAHFARILDDLNRDYRRQGRPYRIQPREQGFELVLGPRYRGILDRLFGALRETRLSPAALDVLSLVAYRQPVSKEEVDSMRGVESGALLRQLVRLGLIAVQRGAADQREASYHTTPRFLGLFQLRSLDDLPRTHDLQKL